MRILVVDDSMAARIIVKRAFQAHGHDVHEAADGAKALEALETGDATDVVVLDWNMPVMDGMQCLLAIRANERHDNTRVVMCSTEAEKRAVLAAIQAGADGYVFKPVTKEQLVTEVERVAKKAA